MTIDWTQLGLVPRKGLLAWHQFEESVSANNLVNDYSGNGRHLTCGAGNSPVLQADLLNGQPGWYFNGSRDPLAWSGSLTTKHLFIVASYEDAAFPDYKGLYSNPGLNSGDILITDFTGDKFFDFSGSLDYGYRKADVEYANNDQKAPMSGSHALLELNSSTGWLADGIQIGDQQALARKWKGWYFESLAYSRVLESAERFDVYAYFAMRYGLWRQVASGLDVWPFQPNWPNPLSTDKTVLASRSVGGSFKAREKRSAKTGWGLSFAGRSPEETDAAMAFWNAKYPGASFIYRDDAYSPARDTEVRFATNLTRRSNSYRDIDYEFQIEEV